MPAAEATTPHALPPPDDAPARSRWHVAWTGWPGKILRLALGVLPLAYLLLRFDWMSVLVRARNVGVWGMVAALALAFASLLIGSLRWHVLLRAYGARAGSVPTVQRLLRHSLVAQYFSMLPTGMAGEAVRGYRVSGCFDEASAAYVLVFVERLAGLVGLLAVAGVAAWTTPVLHVGRLATAMNIGVTLALAGSTVVFVFPQLRERFPAVSRLVGKIPGVGGILLRLPRAQHLRGVVLAVLLSAATQYCVVLSVLALLSPLSPAATLAVCSRVVPAIVLTTYIPVTPGGLGQREGAFALLFGLVHVDPAASVAASLLFFGTLLFWGVVGGGVMVLERWAHWPTQVERAEPT